MKKSTGRLTFAAAATLAGAVIGLGGCHNEEQEPQPGVYGAPEWVDDRDQEEPQPDVYGPPEWFDATETATVTDETEETPVFRFDDNIGPDVYGPPEWFD